MKSENQKSKMTRSSTSSQPVGRGILVFWISIFLRHWKIGFCHFVNCVCHFVNRRPHDIEFKKITRLLERSRVNAGHKAARGAKGCLLMHMRDGCLRLLRLGPDLVHKSPLHLETAFHAPDGLHYGPSPASVKRPQLIRNTLQEAFTLRFAPVAVSCLQLTTRPFSLDRDGSILLCPDASGACSNGPKG